MSINKYQTSLKNSIINVGRIDDWVRFICGPFADNEIIGDYRIQLSDEDEDLRMFIWYKTHPCFNIVLFKHDNVAIMDGLYYNPDCFCTISGEALMARKIVDFTISYIKSKGAVEVQFSDSVCVHRNIKDTHLGPLYFLKFGQTWYERYFGFKPTAEYAKKYEEAKIRQSALSISLNLQDKPCDYFTNEIVDELFYQLKISLFPYICWFKKV